ADVLHIVQALEVRSRDIRIGVVEACGDDETVVRDPLATCQPEGMAGNVESRHRGLVVDVEAGVPVEVLTLQDQALECLDLTPVDVGDATGAGADVLELREHGDRRVRIRLFRRPRRADPRRSDAYAAKP